MRNPPTRRARPKFRWMRFMFSSFLGASGIRVGRPPLETGAASPSRRKPRFRRARKNRLTMLRLGEAVRSVVLGQALAPLCGLGVVALAGRGGVPRRVGVGEPLPGLGASVKQASRGPRVGARCHPGAAALPARNFLSRPGRRPERGRQGRAAGADCRGALERRVGAEPPALVGQVRLAAHGVAQEPALVVAHVEALDRVARGLARVRSAAEG